MRDNGNFLFSEEQNKESLPLHSSPLITVNPVACTDRKIERTEKARKRKCFQSTCKQKKKIIIIKKEKKYMEK